MLCSVTYAIKGDRYRQALPYNHSNLYKQATSVQQPLSMVPRVTVIDRLHCTIIVTSISMTPLLNHLNMVPRVRDKLHLGTSL